MTHKVIAMQVVSREHLLLTFEDKEAAKLAGRLLNGGDYYRAIVLLDGPPDPEDVLPAEP